MTSCYVRLEGVSEDQLEFLGYILMDENTETKVYYHLGDYIIVDKSDPFLFVHDYNDAALLGSEAISVPEND
jgi:hypothetical protein